MGVYCNKKGVYRFALILVFIASNAESASLPLVAQQVKKIVEQNKLVPTPACVDYDFIADDEPGVDVVNVMEKHGGNCLGDPQVQHRLFSVSVDQKTHKMTSDINDPTEPTLSVFPPE